MITGKQLRAARGLLDWGVEQLAEKAKINRDTIFNIEKGLSQPRESTVKSIVRVIEENGVEFTDSEGVRIKPTTVDTYIGPDRFDEFYDFLYEQVKAKGGDICLSVTDERLLGKYRKDLTKHYIRMQDLFDRAVFKSFRILANKSNFANNYPYNTYKWQPEASVSPTAFYTFGDCLALISFVHQTPPYVVVLRSAPIASSYRIAFDAAWAAAIDPPIQP